MSVSDDTPRPGARHRHRRYRLDEPWTTGVVILAAGNGDRLGAGPKALVDLAGEPLLLHVLRSMAGAPSVRAVVVTAPPALVTAVDDLVRREQPRIPARVVPGGPTRQRSALAGVEALPPDLPWVAVTDVARPLTRSAVLDELLGALRRRAGAPCGAAPMVPVVDSLHRVGAGSLLAGPFDRDAVLAAQTPQLFRRACLLDAYAVAARGGLESTDEVGLVSGAGGRVLAVPGDRTNLKVTFAGDMIVADALHRHALATGVRERGSSV